MPRGERALSRTADGSSGSGASSAVVEAPTPRSTGAGLRLPLVIGIVVAVVLIGIGGYFLIVGARANSGAGSQPAAAAQAGSSAQALSNTSAAASPGGQPADAALATGSNPAPTNTQAPSAGSTRDSQGSSGSRAAAAASSADAGVGLYSDAAVERVVKGGSDAAAAASKSAGNPYANAIDLWPPKGAASTAASATDAGASSGAGAAAAATSVGAAGVAAANAAPAYDITKRTEYPPLTSEDAYVKWMLEHYPTEQEKYLRERWNRARIALRFGHITHERILLGFLLTPREWFTRAQNVNRAYENVAMPIGYGQTISGPDLVARMTDYLNPQPGQRVLEIGTGSGYQSAFLSELSNHVFTIEIVKPLAEETNKIYLDHTKELPEYANIHRRIADGYYGWPEYAPFDRIIVTCGIDHIPPDLLKELKPGGIMVIPIGPPSGQTILKITKNVDKDGNITLTREDIYHGTAKDIFVPFTAEGGGRHSLARDVGN